MSSLYPLMRDGTIPTWANIPKELDIFYNAEDVFVNSEQTDEEKEVAKEKYRFNPYIPGLYQTITGFGGFI